MAYRRIDDAAVGAHCRIQSGVQGFADQGVAEIETKEALKVAPFTELGRPLELAKKGFGSPKAFEEAITELEAEIYRQPA